MTAPTSIRSTNPATGELVAEHPVSSPAQVREAVDQARQVAEWWGMLNFDERRRWLLRFKSALVQDADELAELIHDETGKPVADALLEVMLAVEHLDWAARNARRCLGPRKVRSGILAFNQASTVRYQPLGVVGVIGPWNYPVYTPMGAIAYALAAGNAVVFKPSEHTPGVGRWLAERWSRLLPDRPLLQCVPGYGETGAALAESGVDKIAFTGSTATAKKVMATCAGSLTPIVAECGGKDAMIVAADADLEAAATAAVFGAMGNAGQTCAGVERIYAHQAVFDDLLGRIRTKAEGLRPGTEPTASYGPITMPEQIGIIRRHITDALDRGGKPVVGDASSVREPFVSPVVIADVPEDSAAVREESFGPTIVVNQVRDLQHGIRLANASSYGLAACVYTSDARQGIDAAEQLHCGAVSVNSVLGFASVAELPFGGVGDSGFGRVHGSEGLREFSRAKSITRARFRPLLDLMNFDRTARDMGLAKRMLRLRHGRNK